MLLGMHLHSIMFASSLFIPFIAIEYMPKIRDYIYELFEDDEFLVMELDKIKEETIKNKMDYVMNNLDQISAKLRLASRKVAYRNSENISALSNLLE